MIFSNTKLNGVYLLQIEQREDERGYFGRTYCRNEFAEKGIDFSIAQSNISYNKHAGTLRGMHMQTGVNTEAKLVHCVSGSIYDVVIDMRKQSDTYCEWFSVTLSAQNGTMLYIPEGFAHGFLTLENDTRVMYQISAFYTPGSEKAYRWNDPFFNIQWPSQPLVISEKDKIHPLVEINSPA